MSANNIFSANELFAQNTLSKTLPRTKFWRPNTNTKTMSAGKLYPFYYDEVLPGDTHKIDFDVMARMSTPIVPVMDNAVIDAYMFFVPNRLGSDQWVKICGENNDPWAQEKEEILPIITSTDETKTGYDEDTLMGYMPQFPINKKILSKDDGPIRLPINLYCQIWNDYFRDENTQQCIYFDKTDANIDIKNSIPVDESKDTFIVNCQYGIELAPVNKLNDYFTSALPQPQKHEPINIPIGTSAPIKNKTIVDNLFSPTWYDSKGAPRGDVRALHTNGSNGTETYAKSTGNSYGKAYLSLEADLTQASSITMNALRQAEAIQSLFEKDARGGTRYIEVIRSHFGIISPDARMQRAEYIGGARGYINISEVVQQSQNATDNPLGTLGAMSLSTASSHGDITYSATEHGYIIGVVCIRVLHTYGQGYGRMWRKRRRLDYYWPSLAHIGEVPIYKEEIFYNDKNPEENRKIFAYQEYGAEYRTKLNEVHGWFNPNSKKYLSAWRFTDNYENSPTKNSQFMKESRDNIDQTLALINYDQFAVDWYVNNKTTRGMPMHAIPRLGV